MNGAQLCICAGILAFLLMWAWIVVLGSDVWKVVKFLIGLIFGTVVGYSICYLIGGLFI